MAKAEQDPEFVSALERLEIDAGEWRAALDEARSVVAERQPEYDARVEQAATPLRALLDPPPLKSFGSVTLYPNRIAINGVVHNLDAEMNTVAETRGNINRAKRSLLTRYMVAVYAFPLGGLGFFATPKTKKHDDREVVLIVEGSDWAEMATFAPALQRDVVRFAKEIEVAGTAWAAGESDRRPEATRLAQDVRPMRDDRAELDDAMSTLATVHSQAHVQAGLEALRPIVEQGGLSVSRSERKRIDAIQAFVDAEEALPPPPPTSYSPSSTRTVRFADFRTEPLGLMVRRSANDLARGLGRWKSNPPQGRSGTPLTIEELLAIAEQAEAGEPPAAAISPPSPPAPEATVDALSRLAEMHQAGILSDDEFTAAKQQQLGS